MIAIKGNAAIKSAKVDTPFCTEVAMFPRLLMLVVAVVSCGTRADQITLPNTLSNNTPADAAEVQENFDVLASESNENDRRLTAIEDISGFSGATGNTFLGNGLKSVVVGPGLSGQQNIAIGNSALLSNTSGGNNIAIGGEALEQNTEGSQNIAVGQWSLTSNTNGNFNVAIGGSSMIANISGTENTAVGIAALRDNTSGYNNVAVGSQALLGNDIGWSNTAVGYQSQYSTTVTSRNTSLGAQSLYTNTNGFANTAVGHQALYSNGLGDYNTAIGDQALFSSTNGQENTAVGFGALLNNLSGSGNTAIGRRAMLANTSGSNNTVLGFFAEVGSSGLTNATAIGANAVVNASNKIRLGNAAVTVIEGQVPFTSSSDARLKESIESVKSGLSLINDLNPVSYRRKSNENGDIEMGLLAQEVQAALEKHGLSDSGMVHQATPDSHMSLRYNDLLAPMIRAIQELDEALGFKDEQIAVLQDQLSEQQHKLLALIQSQQEQIARLETLVGGGQIAVR